MESNDELVFLGSDGSLCEYLRTKDGSIVYSEGLIDVPGVRKVVRYKGIVTWSLDIPLIKQVNDMHKICIKYFNISNKDILYEARKNSSWSFGEFFAYDAAEIMDLSKQYNLNIEMVDVDSGVKLNI